MTQTLWNSVDEWLADSLIGEDALLDAVQEANAAAGLPAIAVSPLQGRLLCILAAAVGARRILELGTLGGYSGIWLARALSEGGLLVTVEANDMHADTAQRNFDRAGITSLVDLRRGPALEVLAALEAERVEPFDFVFIDADKGNYPEYIERCIGLCRPGSLIVVDNVVREGEVLDAQSSDAAVHAVRKSLVQLGGDTRVTATAVQTVGIKGYDGFAVVRVH